MSSKDKFLGISYGTACNKLKKQIMFSLLQRLGEDTCFKCEKTIDDVSELSVEHKVPWENRENGVELFWDLDNIAFSHLRCNVPHTYRNGNSHLNEQAPTGTLWCSGHKTYINISEFWRNYTQVTGYDSRCKRCKAYERKTTTLVGE